LRLLHLAHQGASARDPCRHRLTKTIGLCRGVPDLLSVMLGGEVAARGTG